MAQLKTIPQNVLDYEVHVLNKLLRLPGQALRKYDILSLPEFNGPKVMGVEVTCKAAMIRYALRTFFAWMGHLLRLKAVAFEELPLAVALGGDL